MSLKYIKYSEKVTELLKVEPQKKYQGKFFLETNNEYNITEFLKSEIMGEDENSQEDVIKKL